MRLLSKHPVIDNTTAVVPLASRLPFLYTARLLTISRMSGYPHGLHSIGRLQDSVDLSSVSSLLTSLFRLQQLSAVTAQVIDTLEATQVFRFQLDRTSITAYVAQITQASKNITFSDEEVDLISHLIVSYEANSAAWILQGGESDGDLHLKFAALYKSVQPGQISDADLPVWSVYARKVEKLGEQKNFAEIRDERKRERAIADHATIHRYALTRIIDHIYTLMLDKDIWYSFVAPRTNSDVAAAIERGKSLRTLALYCQAVLTYPNFFNVEMFMSVYDIIQGWLIQFPPLPTRAVHLLESVIRENDLLGAKDDVHALMASFSTQDAVSRVFPTEYAVQMGLSAKLKEIEDKVGSFTLSGDLSNLKSLSNPTYLPLIAGVAAGTLDAAYSVAKILNTGEEVAEFIRRQTTALLPLVTGATSQATVNRFKKLGLRAPQPFVIPTAMSYHIDNGASFGLEQGMLRLDSGAAPFVWDYHEYIRTKINFQFLTDRQVALGFKQFNPSFAIDFDRAMDLRTLIGKDYRTLVPTSLAAGDRSFNYEALVASHEGLRAFIQSLTATDYEIWIRQQFLEHQRKITATYFSSFALLYIDLSQMSEGLAASDGKTLMPAINGVTAKGLALSLVAGHGNPYGETYTSLSGRQGTLDESTPLISLGMGLYLRLLTKIPVPSDTLKLDTDFYLQRPLLYFAANSEELEVTNFVMAPGLLNFSTFPVTNLSQVPIAYYTPKYVYYAQKLYANIELYYRPSAPAVARETVPVKVSERSWEDDRRMFFLKYVSFGNYGTPEGLHGAEVEGEIVADAIEKIEKAIDGAKAEENKASEAAGAAMAHAATEAVREGAQLAEEATEVAVGATKKKSDGDQPAKL